MERNLQEKTWQTPDTKRFSINGMATGSKLPTSSHEIFLHSAPFQTLLMDFIYTDITTLRWQ